MSTEQSRTDLVAAEAARWFARLSSAQCTAADREAAERWLAADAAHPAAFLEADRLARQLSQALQSDPRLRALAQEARAEVTPAGVSSANPGVRGLLAAPLRIAAVLATCVLGILLHAANRAGDVLTPVASAHYVNTERHQRMVRLPDGTRLHLDAGAQVDVRITSRQRQVTLTRGRAYFDVAHDRARPFSVDAAGTRTIALGTRFEVDLQRADVRVTLAQGSVSVSPTAASADWRQVLRPGEQLRATPAEAVPTVRTIDAERQLAWSRGRLEFDGTPLREALEIFNRYAHVKVLLGDDSLAETPIGGSFAAGADSEAFVSALSAVLPLHVVHAGDDEIVLFQGRQTGGA